MNWLFQPLLTAIARSTENELARQIECLKQRTPSCDATFQDGCASATATLGATGQGRPHQAISAQ